MTSRRKMQDKYRRFSYLSDIGSLRSTLGEMKGIGFPRQPRLNKFPSGKEEVVFDEAWFIESVKGKLFSHPDNILEYPFYGEKIFDAPLIDFVRGDDPIFEKYKKIIGPHHFTPEEIMAWQAEKNGVSPPPAKDLSVVSIVLPITRTTKKENAREKEWVAERWAQTRLSGEIFSQTIIRELVTFLMEKGVLAIAPDATPLFNKKRYPDVGWASPWSQRHIAYAAGLGTFGMHDFFITEKGCAHRLASLVVHRPLKPNRKRPDDIHAGCLHYQGHACMKCAKRCPVNAISKETAHDKEICYHRIVDSIKHCNRNYHIFIYGCGLCATGVPCESRIPNMPKK